MPLYEYSCKKCEHTFETLVYDGETVECPECHGTKLEKLLSIPGLAQVQADGGACGDPSLPPCGAPWCKRTGK
jgi:putative FmdB family regulatory protein